MKDENIYEVYWEGPFEWEKGQGFFRDSARKKRAFGQNP